jgi:hypothetical protein
MKIYINIPERAIAGGVESLYQLADAINNVGGESIVLFDNNVPNPIPDKYSHYNIKYSSEVEDTSNNWIIFPEVCTYRVYDFKNIKRSIWWLSVDNNHGRFQEWNDDSIIHFYQSYYAFSHVLNNEASYYLPIFDYINKKYTSQSAPIENKQDIVCYNPAKGQEITNEIIMSNPDIRFVPLINMTEDQVINTLVSSKVYIDFGNHPGRDRIPREAAILNNCIITNFAGSAMFYNDVSIKTKYKVDNHLGIGDLIRDCFINFETNLSDFELYRTTIRNQQQQMFNQVLQIFDIK